MFNIESKPGREGEVVGNCWAIVGAAATVIIVLGLMIAGIIVLSTSSWGQEHSHKGTVGEFYARWMQPPLREVSCCNHEDCYATPIKLVDGRYYALRREDQRWLLIPPGKLEQQQQSDENILNAPDGRSHACIPKPPAADQHDPETVYCATLGSEM